MLTQAKDSGSPLAIKALSARANTIFVSNTKIMRAYLGDLFLRAKFYLKSRVFNAGELLKEAGRGIAKIQCPISMSMSGDLHHRQNGHNRIAHRIAQTARALSLSIRVPALN